MRSRTVLAVLCVWAVCAPARAEAPLAERLPEGTLAYLGWAGKTAALEQSPAGKLLRLPVVKKVLDTIQAAAKDQLRGHELTAFQHGWQLGMTAIKHPLAVALVDFQMPEQGQEGPPTFLAVVLADLGKDKAEFDKHLAVLLALAGDDIRSEQATGPGGVAYTRLVVKGGPPMAYGYVGNVFFGCVGGPPDALLKTRPATSLARSAAFQKYFGPLDGEHVQSAMYIHVAEALKRIDPMLGPPLGQEPPDSRRPTPRKIMAALGVDKVIALAGAGRIEKGAMVSAAKLYTPAPHRGLLLLAAGGRLALDDLAHGPGADADFAVAFKLSPPAVWKEVRRVVRTIDPRAEEELLEGVNELNRTIKVRLAEELLPLLGDTWVLSSAPSQGGFLTGTVLSVTLTDEAKFRAALAKIEGALAEQMTPPPPPPPAPGDEPAPPRRRRRRGTQLRYTTVQGVKVTYLQFVGQPIPLAPAWAVHRGRLYVALWPQVAATAALGPAGGRLIDDATFQALWKQAGEGASAMTYCNMGSILTQAYNLGLIGWTMGANELSRELNMPVKPDWLPLLSDLVKIFRPTMSSVTPQKDGILCRSVSNLPLPGLSLLPVVGAGMWVSAEHTAELEVQRVREGNTGPAPVGPVRAIDAPAPAPPPRRRLPR